MNENLDQKEVKMGSTELQQLHTEVLTIIKESHTGWESYDYGMGYLYQSYPPLKFRGLRQTDIRFKFYGLDSLLTPGKKVLDIGCNAGFLSLMIAKRSKHIDAFELNPFLIRIAEKCRDFEGIENASFFSSDFDSFLEEQNKTELRVCYDIVLSLANHHTFDEQMRPDFRLYMEQIRGIMDSGGLLIFESHPNEYKKPELKKNIEALSDLFVIEREEVTSTKKSIYDTNRLVMWLKAV